MWSVTTLFSASQLDLQISPAPPPPPPPAEPRHPIQINNRMVRKSAKTRATPPPAARWEQVHYNPSYTPSHCPPIAMPRDCCGWTTLHHTAGPLACALSGSCPYFLPDKFLLSSKWAPDFTPESVCLCRRTPFRPSIHPRPLNPLHCPCGCGLRCRLASPRPLLVAAG